MGADNLALALELNLPRIAELAEGERFTAETAFHMETTLGLPEGFFDHPHPVLGQQAIARLRAPLAQRLAEDAENDRRDQQPVASDIGEVTREMQEIHEVVTVRDDKMAKKASTSPACAPAKKRNNAMSGRQNSNEITAGARKTPQASKQDMQQSLELARTPCHPEIRRANLHMLTSRNGSKSMLGRLLNQSQSNMAHRLHGKKRMDDKEAERFTAALGLPAGWLDTPRRSDEIPKAAAAIITPSSRRDAAVAATRIEASELPSIGATLVQHDRENAARGSVRLVGSNEMQTSAFATGRES